MFAARVSGPSKRIIADTLDCAGPHRQNRCPGENQRPSDLAPRLPTALRRLTIGAMRDRLPLCTDQQVSVQKAFSADLEPAFGERPALHRLPAAMARRVHELAVLVRDRYEGHPERIWSEAKDAKELRANIASLPGFGEMKIKSLGAVLANRFGVKAARDLVPAHPTLGDVDSPQALVDYQSAKKAHKAQWTRMKAGS
jgi:uncharacterized HhH-GPD family protein